MKHWSKWLCCLLFVAGCLPACSADGPILLVTPQGVFQSNVVGNRPGPWQPVSIDVIVQGFTPGGGPINIPPVDQPSDPIVSQIAALSKSILKDKAEATAVAAIVDALAKSGLTGGAFVDAINLSAPLADSSMKSDGRVVKWVAEATKITSDTTKLSAGIRSAFGIESATVAMIVQESNREEGAALAEEAADFAQIIQLVMMIIDLLTKLGIIGG